MKCAFFGTDLFAERIVPHALKPKHVGLMAVLDGGLASSQLDIARTMGVAPRAWWWRSPITWKGWARSSAYATRPTAVARS